MSQHIFLIGRSGAGKSTAGQLIAERTGLKISDCSVILNRKMKMQYNQIISVYGVSGYYDLHNKVLKDILISTEKKIIVIYANNVINPLSRDLIRRMGIVFYLFSNQEILKQRRRQRKQQRSNIKKLKRLWKYCYGYLHSIWLKMITKTKTVNTDLEKELRDAWERIEEGDDDSLYREVAHHIVDTNELNTDQVAMKIIEQGKIEKCL